ncbi:hypothetical protein ALC56_05909 [Trachymyrmex septentrionalis]|uniref:DNA-directed DNA polymerase n=1 Tax=Trachymyrmex septentrionalis TaxID=34720 RepID=A0A151JXY5_9HYME|nr:hypothetical protein ALC56_05909 [Trachymyrmex septentrionalis]
MENQERVERELLEQCSQVATLVECFVWLQRCDECIERLEELCRAERPRLTVGHRQSVVARIARHAREIVLERVQDAVERHGSAKVNTTFNGEFATNNKRDIKSINTKNREIYRYTDLREWYEQHIIEPSSTSLKEFQECDSGWALSRIFNLVVNVNKLNPMRAGCYFEVPREIATKRAVINVTINDCAIRLPNKDEKWLEFGNRCNKERVPFIVYADLECVLWKTEPEGRCIIVRVSTATSSKEQWEAYCSATRYHICEKPFASAHLNCNLNYKNSLYIPIVFHNLLGYDAHFIIKKIATAYEGSYVASYGLDPAHYYTLPGFLTIYALDSPTGYILELKIELYIVGMCVLDISKVCLYEFHDEYMLSLFRDKCKIMYTNTDNLIYRIECEDVYETMKRDIARFDTSDYPTDNAYGISLANKKVPGLMKDENNGTIMTEFVGLRAKMYAVRMDGKKDTKKVKGIKSKVVAQTITFDDYTRCLNEEIEMTRRQSCI